VNKTIKQLFTLFQAIKFKQKVVLVAALTLCVALLGSLIIPPLSFGWTPLFTDQSLDRNERQEVKDFLEASFFSYKEKEEGVFYVAKKERDKIRNELSLGKILTEDRQQGFELFDTNTWIKGEKELQVLEMRALKGQLEKDIAGFDNIKSARVILDLAPQKLFGGVQHKTKASVILNLMGKVELPHSQLRAITYHLAGAVRGLAPNMIAISDTSGRLYKAIHADKEDQFLKDAARNLEESLQAKISQMVTRIVGENHYHLTLNCVGEDQITSIAIALMLDSGSAQMQPLDVDVVKEDITAQLAALVDGFEAKKSIAINFVAFDAHPQQVVVEKMGLQWSSLLWIYLTISLGATALIVFLFNRTKKRRTKDELLFDSMKRVDFETLSDEIQNQEPETIALMISYLEPLRAEELLLQLPLPLQKKVLLLLTESEKEGF